MCENEKPYFIVISVSFWLIMAILSLLTMIFAIIPKNSNDYSIPFYFAENYTILNSLIKKPAIVSQYFLTDIQFSNSDYNPDIFDYNASDYNNNYGYTGQYVKNCFFGFCKKRERTSRNCSETCAISGSSCEVNNITCNDVSCEKNIVYERETICHYYNIIYYWRGKRDNIKLDKFYFSPLEDLVLSNETCQKGFHPCGYINKEKDILCVNDTTNCPINKVVIKDDNTPPTDFEYTSRQFGDKYLFYTNQNIDNFIYSGFIVDSGIAPTEYTDIIDTQPLKDLLTENPYIYDGNYTSKSAEELSEYGDAKLKMYVDFYQESLAELRKKTNNSKNEYLKRTALYTDEILNEMNSKVINYQLLLFGFNIAGFVNIMLGGFLILLFFCIFEIDQVNLSSPAACFVNQSPMKKVLFFYLFLSPVIYINFHSFIMVIQNKKTYSQYYAMSYIREYIPCSNVRYTHIYDDTPYNPDYDNYKYKSFTTTITYTYEYTCFFDDLNFYNNALFICYIIEHILTILYPLIITLLSVKYNCSKPKVEYDIDKLYDQPRESINESDNCCGCELETGTPS